MIVFSFLFLLLFFNFLKFLSPLSNYYFYNLLLLFKKKDSIFKANAVYSLFVVDVVVFY